MEVLQFNQTSLKTFNTYWDGSKMYITPEKDVTFFTVPGRSGELSIFNDRFKAKKIPFECFIRNNFQSNFANLMNFLYSQDGYGRLENSFESDIYQKACFVEAVDPKTGPFLKSGTFRLVFNVYPQKWLKSGETAITYQSGASATLENPTLFDAKPLIAVTGTGTITINDSVLVLANNTSTTYIDCEIEDAYEGAINRNSDLTITNGFPVLNPGDNDIETNGCSIELTPRWWRL